MILEISTNEDGYYVLKRDSEVVLISRYPARVADVVHDLLVNKGVLTLIPEPQEQK